MAQGIAAIGECMLELSGQSGSTWRMGHGGDTFNTLWALRALSPGHHIDYISAFGDDPLPGPNGPSPTGAPMRLPDGWLTIRPDWQKALKTGRLSIFPESPWQSSTRMPARSC